MVRWDKSKTKKAEKGELNDVVVDEFGDTKTIPRSSSISGFRPDQELIGVGPATEDFVDWEAGDKGFVYSGSDIFLVFKTETNFSYVVMTEFVLGPELEMP
jgi:hypothetical protein